MKFPYIYFLFFMGLFIFAVYMAYNEEKPEQTNTAWGQASKITFDKHSYVIWHNNWSDCILHDPDCECRKKIKEKKNDY